MRDFTLKIYKRLLQAFQQQGYSFLTFRQWCEGTDAGRFVILRHDVDEMARNALKMAKLENELGIKATYNFRVVRQSNRPAVIEQIKDLGHEIGYHYEDLVWADGDMEKAITSFRSNLAYFRQYYDVKTISMHGSSTSVYDNRDLWKAYDWKTEGLLGEPYLSIDFTKMYYLSDTGYCWDGRKTAVRDVVESAFPNTYHYTLDIIKAVEADTFPPQAMISAHTLWTDNRLLGTYTSVREWLRNGVKRWSIRNAFVKKIYGKFVSFYWRK